MNTFYVNQRVYYRKGDLFGHIESIEKDQAMVKFEWPYDPELPAKAIDIDRLQPAHEVEFSGEFG